MHPPNTDLWTYSRSPRWGWGPWGGGTICWDLGSCPFFGDSGSSGCCCFSSSYSSPLILALPFLLLIFPTYLVVFNQCIFILPNLDCAVTRSPYKHTQAMGKMWQKEIYCLQNPSASPYSTEVSHITNWKLSNGSGNGHYSRLVFWASSSVKCDWCHLPTIYWLLITCWCSVSCWRGHKGHIPCLQGARMAASPLLLMTVLLFANNIIKMFMFLKKVCLSWTLIKRSILFVKCLYS